MMIDQRGDRSSKAVAIRSSAEFAGGLVLLGIAAFVLWATQDLTVGTFDEIGAGMIPRLLAAGLGLCGLGLLVRGLMQAGEAVSALAVRGTVFVTLAILIFALTIRSFPMGGFNTPGLGLLIAGPVAVFLSGHASREADGLELLILALGLTAFCMVLFGDLLNLQIPMFPDFMQGMFPAGWSQKAQIRAAAAVLAAVALALGAVQRRRNAVRKPARDEAAS